MWPHYVKQIGGRQRFPAVVYHSHLSAFPVGYLKALVLLRKLSIERLCRSAEL